MSSSTLSFSSLKPPSNIGMKTLDHEKFRTVLPLVVAEIENPRMLAKIIKSGSKQDLLDISRVPTIVVLERESKKRGVLLAPHITDPASAAFQLQDNTKELLNEASATFKPWELELGYNYWTADDILHSIIPPELGDIPSGFSLVGHIAHLNLQEQFLPYKHLIGEVLLDKNQPAVKTVVNKLDNINSVYRTFDMEVIAGVPDFTVLQHESGCRFQFDFRKVYWNSRLHTEHDRLVSLFGEDNAICDPMAGVGPFAIPSAKKGNIVFANDLNPDSYDAMNKNIALNKLNPEAIQTFNEDARVFIQKSIERLHSFRKKHGITARIPINSTGKEKAHSQDGKASSNPKSQAQGTLSTSPPRSKRKVHQPKSVQIPETFSHYVMNLPASAIEFLDAFRGLYSNAKFSTPNPPLPIVHVHCFYKFEAHQAEPERPEVQKSIAARVSKAIGYEIKPDQLSLHDVRRVAPTKDMYEVSFQLPHDVAYMQQN